jgi:hypothetical protein
MVIQDGLPMELRYTGPVVQILASVLAVSLQPPSAAHQLSPPICSSGIAFLVLA